MAETFSDRDYEALASFRHALRRFLRFSEQAARDAGITPGQHQLLLAVRGFPGPAAPTTAELADMLQVRHHSAVELIDRAEEAGLVVRTVDPHDARKRRIALSDDGHDLLARLTLAHRDELRRFRDQMGAVLDGID